MTTRAALPLLVLALVTGCPQPGTDAGPDDDGGVVDGGDSDGGGPFDGGEDDAGALDGGVDAGPRFLTEFTTLDDLTSLAVPGGEVKFLAPIEGMAPLPPLVEPCYFQNMNITPWHLVFLTGFPETADIAFEEYVSWVLRRDTRRWWGGAVKFYPMLVHPVTGEPPVIAYTIYAETPVSTLVVDEVAEVQRILASCIPFGASFLAFLPSDASQVALVQDEGAALTDAGVAFLDP